jgi:hypothetical protein
LHRLVVFISAGFALRHIEERGCGPHAKPPRSRTRMHRSVALRLRARVAQIIRSEEGARMPFTACTLFRAMLERELLFVRSVSRFARPLRPILPRALPLGFRLKASPASQSGSKLHHSEKPNSLIARKIRWSTSA